MMSEGGAPLECLPSRWGTALEEKRMLEQTATNTDQTLAKGVAWGENASPV